MTDTADILATFQDLFAQFFSGNITVELAVTDDEAATGTTRDVQIQRHVPCVTCQGSGGDGRSTCAACGGDGKRSQTSGAFHVSSACPACQGRGATYTRACETCHGSRVSAQTATLGVRIPAGSTHASTLRLAGQGNYKADGTRGDVLATLLVGGRAAPPPQAFAAPPLTAALPGAIVRQRASSVWPLLVLLAMAGLVGLLISR